jgi:hypothetical protein
VQKIKIEGVDVTRAILGCDSFVSWLYEGGDSPFKGADGNVDSSKVLEVMRVSAKCGVRCIDLSPPMVDAFKILQNETDGRVEALGALQEWTCRNFIIDHTPLAELTAEIKASMRSKLSPRYLEELKRSSDVGSGFARSFFEPAGMAEQLTKSEIDRIRMKPDFYKERLELYRKLKVKLVQFGGQAADWLIALGRIDLLRELSKLIRNNGFVPLLICHWTSLVLPIAERELDVAGYIVPLNRLWSLTTLPEACSAIKNAKKPVVAMKTLARGVLGPDLDRAFTFVIRQRNVEAVLVSVSSKAEARQTFSALGEILR